MVGGVELMNIKPLAVAVPPGVVTDIRPEDPNPTTAEIVVLESTINDEAWAPPKLTEIALSKFIPIIVMGVPAPAELSEKELIVGADTQVNPLPLAVPYKVATEILPDAPVPTSALIWVGEIHATDVAGTPPKLTLVPV